MPNIREEYDVIVVGAGHAGCEAARYILPLNIHRYKVQRLLQNTARLRVSLHPESRHL